MSNETKTTDSEEGAKERLAADPEVTLPAQVEDSSTSESQQDREPFEIPPELLDLLRSTGKEWQGKAEAALALWLDEASLALRREGLPGLRRVMREKAESARGRAESGSLEKDFDTLIGRVVGTIGRDIASAAISAAFAGFASGGSKGRPGSTEGRQDGPQETKDEPDA